MTDITWTDARVKTLRDLWPTLTSAREIGERCGGLSKSTVIGKANRLRLGVKQSRDMHKPRAVKKQKLELVPKNEKHSVVYPEPKAFEDISENDTPDFPVTLEELEPNMCRWPIGDPLADIVFCGQPTAGKPFCDCHDRRAYEDRKTKTGEPRQFRQRRFGGYR